MMLQARVHPCPACLREMVPTRRDWLCRCRGCGFLASSLTPRINRAHGALDEERRGDALSPLRRANFRLVLDTLGQAGLAAGGRLLDVGCAHGWFLELAAARGLGVTGIEPDGDMADIARASGLDVRQGYFPGAVGAGERFDAIVFNDVLEHIPDIAAAVRAAAAMLAPGGLLSVNLPLSTGVFYRAADLLDRAGIDGPFARMWQKPFPSPHLSYVTQDNLARLVRRAGLEEVSRRFLPSVTMEGLWQRLTYDSAMPRLAAAAVYAGVAAVRPLLPLLPQDIGLQVFRKPEA